MWCYCILERQRNGPNSMLSLTMGDGKKIWCPKEVKVILLHRPSVWDVYASARCPNIES